MEQPSHDEPLAGPTVVETGPYSAALAAIEDLDRFAHFAWNGLGYAESERAVVEVLRTASTTQGTSYQDEAVVARRLKQIEKTEPFAAEQRRNGFPLLYELLVVRLWSILEGLVDDLVANALATHPEAITSDALRKIRGPLLEFLMASPTERAEYLADLLTQEVKAKLKQGVGRFEAVLTEVGMGGGVSDHARRALAELSEVRNVVVHRGGRADTKLLDRCPWLGLKAGDRVPLSPTRFEAYLAASHWYILELSRRATPPENPGEHEMLREVQGVVERAIAARMVGTADGASARGDV